MDKHELAHPRYPHSDKDHADAASWVFRDSKAPHPELYYYKLPALQPGEVTVQVLFTSLCKSDLHTVRGDWGPCATWPFCPGHEVIGRVVAVASDCKKLKQDMIVGVSPLRNSCNSCEYCTGAIDQHCEKRKFLYANDQPFFGGYSTHVQCQEKHAVPIPSGLNLANCAPLLCAGLTVFSPLKKHGKPGLKCAVVGIGGLGHLGIQFASKMGMEVTAFTTSEDRQKELKELGATELRHSTNLDKLRLEEGKYHLVLNTLSVENQNVYKAHQRLVAPGGTLIMVAVPSVNTGLILDVAQLLTKSVTVAGSLIGSTQDVVDMFQFCQNYGVEPVVEHYTFDRMPEAFDKLEKGHPKYRVSVDVQSWAKANLRHK